MPSVGPRLSDERSSAESRVQIEGGLPFWEPSSRDPICAHRDAMFRLPSCPANQDAAAEQYETADRESEDRPHREAIGAVLAKIATRTRVGTADDAGRRCCRGS